ncbi:MAG: L-lactate dehydrogenase (quinone) large subunit LdhH [Pedobacter sp.]
MSRRARHYRHLIDQALSDVRRQDALHRFGDAYLAARAEAFADLDFEGLRHAIAAMKDTVRDDWPHQLKLFMQQAEATGAKVFLAQDAQAANTYITELAQRHEAHLAVKSKSMAGEEIALNHALEDIGMRVVETDLGEWIVQLAGQRPSHMVMPAIHMFRDQVAELFGTLTGEHESEDIAHLVEVARRTLRKEFLNADMGISGANLAVVEDGSLALVTNEGNARLVATIPPVHVVLVGIDKLVPSLEDAVRVLQVLPRNATAQAASSYVTWLRGPSPGREKPRELHIVLLDNGRSKLALSKEACDAWRCLRCGACANVCPVYQTIGGHVFGHVYVGAIGIVLTAFLHGLNDAAELIHACIGCRACVNVCPAHIDLEHIILGLRRRLTESEGVGAIKDLVFKRVLRNRRLFHGLLRTAARLQKPITGNASSIRHLPLFFSSLTEWRTLPAIAERPLRDLLAEQPGVASPRLRVALFGGCAAEFVLPDIGLALARLFRHFSIELVYPEGQSCCGIPALYAGDAATATELARQNVVALAQTQADAVVTVCPTCTTALTKHFPELLADDPALADCAAGLAAITRDAAVLLVEQLADASPAVPPGSAGTVTYHDSCHLRRGSNVHVQPRQLLAGAGWQLTEMAHSDRCCGFGGSYSVLGQPSIARAIAKDKLADILATGAEVVAADCPGCLIMLRGLLEKNTAPIRVVHSVQLLAASLTDN